MADGRLHDPREALKPLADAGVDGAQQTVTLVVENGVTFLTTAQALVVTGAFNLILAFERSLASFPLIHPVLGWMFFGALLGATIGGWRQLPRYRLEHLRPGIALLPVGLLAIGLLLDSGPTIGATDVALLPESMATATAGATPAAARARGAKVRQAATPTIRLPLRTAVDTVAHSTDETGQGTTRPLPKGTEVEVLERKGDWLRVQVPEWEGEPIVYISRSSMFPINPVDPRSHVGQ